MKVEFKNIGMIEAADIRFDGLTVIAGENDTGKSTVGRLMFSLIKTFNQYDKKFAAYYRIYITSVFGVLDGDIGSKFFTDRKYSIVGKKEDEKIFEIIEKKTGSPGDIEAKLFHQPSFGDATFIESPMVLNQADAIRFSKTLLDVEGDIKKKVKLLDRAYVAESLRDFILKVTDRPGGGKPPGMLNTIREIINGNFYYDHKKKDFVFEKGGNAFGGLWTASGIKVLGILGILLENGFLNDKSLLVIDEPETHMHPLWKIHLAEILVELTKAGITILLTSHSPYLVEALKLYSDKKLPPGKAAFYLSKKNDDRLTSSIIEVTQDISPIFKLMADPFRKLEMFQVEDI
jgi:hypothetical protein